VNVALLKYRILLHTIYLSSFPTDYMHYASNVVETKYTTVTDNHDSSVLSLHKSLWSWVICLRL